MYDHRTPHDGRHGVGQREVRIDPLDRRVTPFVGNDVAEITDMALFGVRARVLHCRGVEVAASGCTVT
jgi:hypothetical protein